MQLPTPQFVQTVYPVGWALLVKTSVHMESKYLWTVETVSAIRVTLVADAMWSAQGTESASMMCAYVINLLAGEVPCAKCPDVLVQMERTVVEMANVTVQTISVFVNQVKLAFLIKYSNENKKNVIYKTRVWYLVYPYLQSINF